MKDHPSEVNSFYGMNALQFIVCSCRYPCFMPITHIK
jgi:hypothetical protein